MAIVGLALIVIGWIIQLVYAFKGKKEIQPRFIIAYAVGVLLLVVDGFICEAITIASLNLICLVVAAVVLFKVKPQRLN